MGLIGIKIVDDKNVIRIINGTSALLVHKSQVRTIDVLQDNVRIDIGEGALHHIYVQWSTVSDPVTPDVQTLRDAIATMLLQPFTLTGAGDATAANQGVEIGILQEMSSILDEIRNGISFMVNDIFNNPLAIDESVPNVVYYGYAYPGAKPDDAKWAVKRVTRTGDLFTYEWANGAQTFVSAWSNRYGLVYQKL
ncbi:hypothetical protein HGH93_12065 [Chitinophaga polysaccharea]|uniref:hypothetical protein n=1 Tax=Chitinophaga polysaccharea TaxID=1293035 RepID=UPI001454EAD6|nr:hypothetical protein [Chitinophaga polysaccharea]NLR58842.1 hypothetical protein [Chitinophaga polysaccharea]